MVLCRHLEKEITMKMPARNLRPAHTMMGPQHFRLAEAAGLLALPTGHIYEFNGGVGDMGVAMLGSVSGAKLISCDIDSECVSAMKKRRKKEGLMDSWVIRCCDSFAELNPTRNSGVVFDCNTFTFHQMLNVPEFKTAFDRTLEAKVKWILINDSAKFKLHLNYKSYGCLEPTVPEYLRCWNDYLGQVGYLVDAYVDLRTTLMLRIRRGIHKSVKETHLSDSDDAYYAPS